MYRVFLGAPSPAELATDPSSYQWQTISSSRHAVQARRTLGATQSVIFPPATLEAASRRISRIYENAIFDDNEPEEEQFDEPEGGGASIAWLACGVSMLTLR